MVCDDTKRVVVIRNIASNFIERGHTDFKRQS